jgi:YfiR/HmsC-like
MKGSQFARACCIVGVSLASAQTMDEYQVKAGFVSSFASYVEWPAETFKGPQEPIAICVLGQNPFGNALHALVEGKVVEGRTFIIRQIPDSRQAGECQILYISSSEHLRLRMILGSLGDKSIFSVGDTSDFIAEGGIVNLHMEGGRVSIEINSDAAKAKHLRISSRLLQLAKNMKR